MFGDFSHEKDIASRNSCKYVSKNIPYNTSKDYHEVSSQRR